ncbi:MAG: hypothetical protein R3C58_05695 [Parvularculaceae bacterium]
MGDVPIQAAITGQRSGNITAAALWHAVLVADDVDEACAHN